jgi:hypothetical protein
MPIYEVAVKGPPDEFHYVMATDPKLAKQRVKLEVEKRDRVEFAHSSLTGREMGFDESLTLCSEYKPMTHLVDEWFYLLSGLKEKKSEHPAVYLGRKA